MESHAAVSGILRLTFVLFAGGFDLSVGELLGLLEQSESLSFSFKENKNKQK